MHTTAAAPALPWDAIPTEMKFSVVAHLDHDDLRAFSKVNKDAYAVAVPALWRVCSPRALNPPPRAHVYARPDRRPATL